ncbi:energy transducer TonB [uncultured Draconibacterium sp.]|uniref:energy transducer TonB n=1 Tax=uncultured Draconibacterium sp. TaxID=1573823 RepID=UPI0025D94354|nr:energy transducer TonB [uncultured Draconibacterium sp.]
MMKRTFKNDLSKNYFQEQPKSTAFAPENGIKLKIKKTKNADIESKKTTLFLIGLVIALCLVFTAFEWKTPVNKARIVEGYDNFIPPEDLVIPITKTEKPESEKPVITVPVFKVVKDNVHIKEELLWEGDDPEEPVLFDFESLFKANTEKEENLDHILDHVEIMPEFPGGDAALLSYLAHQVKYPAIAQENGIQGRVYISFVIDENGTVFNVTLARGVDASLNTEAIRVVESMPRWKPGRQGDKAVKVRYTVPINFILR